MPPAHPVVSFEEVCAFLRCFQERLSQHGVVVYPREKNFQALLDLEIAPEERDGVLATLTPYGYCKGPKADTVVPGTEYWEFGAWQAGRELYVKISLGHGHGHVWCLSFHAAERTMRYAFAAQAPIPHFALP